MGGWPAQCILAQLYLGAGYLGTGYLGAGHSGAVHSGAGHSGAGLAGTVFAYWGHSYPAYRRWLGLAGAGGWMLLLDRRLAVS